MAICGRAWRAGAGTAALLLAVTAVDSRAVRTRFFRAEGYESFKRCELRGAALSQDGVLFPAPRAVRLGDPLVRSVWGLLEDSSGRLILATGDQGQVFTQTGEEEPKLLASLFNYELFACAADREGNLYAAGAPSGSVVRISKDGSTQTIFDAPEGLVLALLAGPEGDLYAAAGERGRLYRIPRNGEAKVVSESGDLHLRSLAWSSDGKRIWAGTDGRGLVQEIDPATGSTRVVYDAPEEEIVSLLVLPDGTLFFGANPGPGSGSSDGDSPPSPTTEVTPTVEPPKRGSTPVLYKMSSNGSVRLFWQCPERTLHALLLEEDGSILAATGAGGTVYRVSPEGKETVLWRAEESQVLALARHQGAVVAGTGNPGRVYRLGPAPDPDAEVLSEVLDAQDQALWGNLRWHAEGDPRAITFETRSGFTSLPR